MPEKWLSNHKHSFYVPKSQMGLHLTLLQDNLLNVGRYGFLIAYIIISAGINELLGPEQNRPCKKVASWLNTNSFISKSYKCNLKAIYTSINPPFHKGGSF